MIDMIEDFLRNLFGAIKTNFDILCGGFPCKRKAFNPPKIAGGIRIGGWNIGGAGGAGGAVGAVGTGGVFFGASGQVQSYPTVKVSCAWCGEDMTIYNFGVPKPYICSGCVIKVETKLQELILKMEAKNNPDFCKTCNVHWKACTCDKTTDFKLLES